ncbi:MULTISPECIES: type II toxin-antitoxin system YafO family toxin [Pseudomonas]|uniref:type II toxin-antitoxin system YafO family toxin n=1 Tax=Pseudomonas TaxID=286 RepID=UPI002899828A|nr:MULTISPECIES: type II toxin-antitoxin system YafO family toxin [Pseudomonas]
MEACSVEIHELFCEQFGTEDPELLTFRDELIEAFKYWAEYGDHPDFGKNFSYRDPEGSVVPNSGLRHVHLRPLNEKEAIEKKWDHPDPVKRTSNRHLVYVRSDCGHKLVLYYFQDNAHVEARKNQYKFLKSLGRAAEEWLKLNKYFPDTSDY